MTIAQLSVDARNGLTTVTDQEELDHLSARLVLAHSSIRAIPEHICKHTQAYVTRYNDLITRKITLLRSDDSPYENVKVKLEGIKADIAFLHAQIDGGIPIADNLINDLYCNLQLIILDMTTLDPSQYRPFLYDIHNTLFLIHQITEKQIFRHAASDPLAQELYAFSHANDAFLWCSGYTLEELESNRANFSSTLERLKGRVREVTDKSRQALYVSYMMAMEDGYNHKTRDGIALPYFFVSAMKHFCTEMPESTERLAEIEAMQAYFSCTDSDTQTFQDLRESLPGASTSSGTISSNTTPATIAPSPFEPVKTTENQ